jgi:hypothetical protein
MPLDFSPIGINDFILPRDAGLLASFNIAADTARLDTLKDKLAAVKFHNIDRVLVVDNNKDKFIPYNAASPSYIEIQQPDGTMQRNYVKAHIGNGTYGSICLISTTAAGDGLVRILKMQKIPYQEGIGIDMINDMLIAIKEAIINFILCSKYPDFINTIFTVGMRPYMPELSIRIFFVLEKLSNTLNADIQRIGNPGDKSVKIGNYLKPKLCHISRGLKVIFDELGGNHGDLKGDNVMDNKLIDFGLFRLTYEDVILSCSEFNNRSCNSRDLTILTYYIWHYTDGRRCSIRHLLEPMLIWDNPSVATFSQFESWTLRNAVDPNFKMTIIQAENNRRKDEARANAAGKPAYDVYIAEQSVSLESFPPVDLGPLYKYFNVFDNPNCNFDIVSAEFCGPVGAPGGAVGAPGGAVGAPGGAVGGAPVVAPVVGAGGAPPFVVIPPPEVDGGRRIKKRSRYTRKNERKLQRQHKRNNRKTKRKSNARNQRARITKV